MGLWAYSGMRVYRLRLQCRTGSGARMQIVRERSAAGFNNCAARHESGAQWANDFS